MLPGAWLTAVGVCAHDFLMAAWKWMCATKVNSLKLDIFCNSVSSKRREKNTRAVWVTGSNPGAYWVCMEPHDGVDSRKGLRSQHTPVLSALGRLSWEDWRLKACQSFTVRPLVWGTGSGSWMCRLRLWFGQCVLTLRTPTSGLCLQVAESDCGP